MGRADLLLFLIIKWLRAEMSNAMLAQFIWSNSYFRDFVRLLVIFVGIALIGVEF